MWCEVKVKSNLFPRGARAPGSIRCTGHCPCPPQHLYKAGVRVRVCEGAFLGAGSVPWCVCPSARGLLSYFPWLCNVARIRREPPLTLGSSKMPWSFLVLSVPVSLEVVASPSAQEAVLGAGWGLARSQSLGGQSTSQPELSNPTTGILHR